jgi:hypothetical protein
MSKSDNDSWQPSEALSAPSTTSAQFKKEMLAQLEKMVRAKKRVWEADFETYKENVVASYHAELQDLRNRVNSLEITLEVYAPDHPVLLQKKGGSDGKTADEEAGGSDPAP